MEQELNQIKQKLAALEPEVRLTNEMHTEKLEQQHNEISTIFLKLGEVVARVAKIERWQSNLCGQESARSSAWGAAKYVVSLIAGLIGALAGAYFSQ